MKNDDKAGAKLEGKDAELEVIDPKRKRVGSTNGLQHNRLRGVQKGAEDRTKNELSAGTAIQARRA